jgi:prepilin-type N-terminal cleavage/methylation domain-containing protein
MNKQRGFTLIEIAIVLVIIGLLLGGVLKGQELITGARVRNLISQQDGVKAAYYGFLDRFRALPGDYALATTNINGTTVKGNGNGQVEATATVVNGSTANEDIAVWEHLSKAGFITGSYTPGAAYTTTSAPANPYGAFMVMRYDNGYADSTGTSASRHNLKTGSQIPADLLAEIDRKIDDGAPDTGSFRFSAIAATGTAPTTANCMTAGTAPAAGTWKLTGSIEPNCGAATVF